MRYLSLCSGIEAASLAFNPLGWQAAAVAEVNPFCCAVLQARFPEVVNRGDITRFMEWPDDDAIDLVCGGTPCPSFSTAGLRAGLDDPRGDLALTFLGIAGRYRPRWVVWENVPGILFSNGGRDLGAFLGLLGQCGYGYAFRVLDAQYFGLAQRRRRLFVVGHLGDWHPAAAVLLDASCMRGDPAPPRRQGEDHARESARSPGRDSQPYEVANVLTKRMHKGINSTMDEGQTLVLVNPAPAHNPHRPCHLCGYVFNQDLCGAWGCPNCEGEGLDDSCPLFRPNSELTDQQERDQEGTGEADAPVAFPAYLSSTQRASTADLAPSLQHINPTAVSSAGGVRKLTPREAERLQGLPDDWTQVTYRGRPAKDEPRYQAIGNSWPVPVVQWIARRIDLVQGLTPAPDTLAAPLQGTPEDITGDYRKKAQESRQEKAPKKGLFSEGKGLNLDFFNDAPGRG